MRLSSAVNQSCSITYDPQIKFQRNTEASFKGSVPSAQRGISLKTSFHQHRHHGGTQPKQKAPKGLRGTCEYNIGSDSRQKIAEEETSDEGEGINLLLCLDN